MRVIVLNVLGQYGMKRMDDYKPRLDDYVQYRNIEGWIYFVCPEYITIEIGTKDKTEKQLKTGTHHRKDHILVLCYSQYWNELKYIRSR